MSRPYKQNNVMNKNIIKGWNGSYNAQSVKKRIQVSLGHMGAPSTLLQWRVFIRLFRKDLTGLCEK